MVGRRCCVPGCHSTSFRNPDVSFNSFPRNDELRNKWIQIITLNACHLSPSKQRPWCTPVSRKPIGQKNHTVCGYHFNKSGRKEFDDKVPKYFGNDYNYYAVEVSHEVEVTEAKEPLTVSEVVSCEVALEFNSLSHNTNRDKKGKDHNYSLAYGGVSLHEIIKAQQNEIYQLRTALELQEKVIAVNHKLLAENEELKAKQKLVEEYEQTFQSMKMEMSTLKDTLASLRVKYLEYHSKVNKLEKESKEAQRFCLDKVSHSDLMIQFYTGCQNLEGFNDLYVFIEPDLKNLQLYKAGSGYKRKRERSDFDSVGRPMVLPFRDQLFMVLCRLKVGLLEEDLAYRFHVSVSTVSNICVTWFDLLYQRLSRLQMWPSRKLVDEYMPAEFKEKYPKTRVVVDATELFIQKPNDFRTQSDTWSSYKTHNTAKGLIGITPNGFISFVSDLVPGRMSDRELTERSGLLELLERGDSLMSDRGFVIEELLREKGVTLNMPPFLHNNPQLSYEQEMATREIASVRIHVERVIRIIKKYHILSIIFPNTMHSQLNKVWKICVFLVNFCNEPLLDVNKGNNDAAHENNADISESNVN